MDPIEPWVDREELRRMADALLAKPLAAPPAPTDATYGDDFVGYAGGDSEVPLPPGPAPDAPPAPHPNQPAAPSAVPAPPPKTAPVALVRAGDSPAQSPAETSARQALATARDIAQRGGLLIEPAPAPEVSPPPGAAPVPAPAAPAAAPPPAAGPISAAELTQVSPLPGTPDFPRAPVSTPFLARLKAYGTWLQEGIRAKAFFVLDREGGVLIDEVQSPKLQQVARTLAQASHLANRQAGAAAIGNIPVKIAPENTLEVVPVLTRYGPLVLGIIVDHPLSSRNVETVARGLQQVIDGTPGEATP